MKCKKEKKNLKNIFIPAKKCCIIKRNKTFWGEIQWKR